MKRSLALAVLLLAVTSTPSLAQDSLRLTGSGATFPSRCTPRGSRPSAPSRRPSALSPPHPPRQVPMARSGRGTPGCCWKALGPPLVFWPAQIAAPRKSAAVARWARFQPERWPRGAAIAMSEHDLPTGPIVDMISQEWAGRVPRSLIAVCDTATSRCGKTVVSRRPGARALQARADGGRASVRSSSNASENPSTLTTTRADASATTLAPARAESARGRAASSRATLGVLASTITMATSAVIGSLSQWGPVPRTHRLCAMGGTLQIALLRLDVVPRTCRRHLVLLLGHRLATHLHRPSARGAEEPARDQPVIGHPGHLVLVSELALLAHPSIESARGQRGHGGSDHAHPARPLGAIVGVESNEGLVENPREVLGLAGRNPELHEPLVAAPRLFPVG